MRVRRIIGGLLLLALVVLPAPAKAAGVPGAGFRETLVASGFTTPTAIAFLPDRSMLVTEKGGALRLVAGGTTTTLATISVCSAAEMGLLGVAVDPGFASNGYIYLYRTVAGPGGCGTMVDRFNQVIRVTMSGGTVNLSSLTVLLTGIRTGPAGNHNAGTVRVGPDAKLYVSVGDTGIGDMGGPGESTNPYSQDRNVLEGKVLRLELDGSPASGNPYIGDPTKRGEIWAYGFRNPFRFGIDPVTGFPWLGDVGQSTLEELDIIVAGGNYSWPYCEGTLPAGCQQPGDIAPIFVYPLSGAGSLGRTITGGAFAPSGFGDFGFQYFFADNFSSNIYRAVPNAARNGIVGTPSQFVTAGGNPSDIVFGPEGALYYVALGAGEIRRVVPSYPTPRSAKSINLSLVPAFKQCSVPLPLGAGAANATHAAPLALPSCEPPQPTATVARVGPRMTGNAQLVSLPGDDDVSNGDQADVAITASLSDIRTGSSSGPDYDPNAGPAADLSLNARLRMTDRLDTPIAPNTCDEAAAPVGGCPGTSDDSIFTALISCTPNSDPARGSTCNLNTTADAVLPASGGLVKERVRSNIAVFRVAIRDVGSDTVAGNVNDTLFAQQGLFVR